jgi:hypothetical protein
MRRWLQGTAAAHSVAHASCAATPSKTAGTTLDDIGASAKSDPRLDMPLVCTKDSGIAREMVSMGKSGHLNGSADEQATRRKYKCRDSGEVLLL